VKASGPIKYEGVASTAQRKELNADLASNLRGAYGVQKELDTYKSIISSDKEMQKDKIYYPIQKSKAEPRVEDRLMGYKKSHKNWAVQEKFKRKSRETDELTSLIRIKPHKEFNVQALNIAPTRIETSPEAVFLFVENRELKG
jgi:hypothetical protein